MSPHVEGLGDLVEIGRGGFGTVYRATDERFGRQVAVKVIRGSGRDEESVARFERECRALGSLSGHPNIVAIHDSGQTDDGDLYLVLELLPGGSLADAVATSGPLAARDVLAQGIALAGALETAHRVGIVHRDLKPENVLYSSVGVPKIVDFGIARMQNAHETRTGSLSATLGHVAPEALAGAPASPAADVYSLSSVLHFALAGTAPFHRDGEQSLAPLMARIATEPPPDLRELDVPGELADVVERGLAKDPADRYASAEELGAALQSAAVALGHPLVDLPVASASDVDLATGLLGREATPAPSTIHVARRSTASSAPAPGEQTRGGRRWVLVGCTSLLVLALLAGVGAALARRGDASGPRLLAPEAISLTERPVDDDGIEVRRALRLSEDRRDLEYTVRLANRGAEEVERAWFEAIPEEVTASVDSVAFEPEPTGTAEEAALAYWVVTLPPGSTRTISWRVPLPDGAGESEEYLERVRLEQRVALAEGADAVAFLTALLSSGEAGSGEEPGGDGPVDPGAVDPGAGEPDGADPGAGGSVDPGSGDGRVDPGSGGRDPGVDDDPVVVPSTPQNRGPSLSVSNRSNDEGQQVHLAIAASDPDGDQLHVSVRGLPAGLTASGLTVSGKVSHAASSATTDRREGIRSTSFPVTVTVSDGRGGQVSRSFNWTIRDTQRLMPNYIDQYGCAGCGGLPDVAAVSSPSFECAYSAGADGNRVFRQSVAPGSVIAWGRTVTYWYGKDDTSCARVAKGW